MLKIFFPNDINAITFSKCVYIYVCVSIYNIFKPILGIITTKYKMKF